MTLLLQYLGVAGLCALKFVPGAALGIGLQFGFLEQVAVTATGGIVGTTFFTYFGGMIRAAVSRLRTKQDPDTPALNKPPRPRSLGQRVWARMGLLGVAALTPPLLSPPVGTAIAVAFRADRRKIVAYMAISMIAWACLFAWMGTGILALLSRLGLYSAIQA